MLRFALNMRILGLKTEENHAMQPSYRPRYTPRLTSPLSSFTSDGFDAQKLACLHSV